MYTGKSISELRARLDFLSGQLSLDDFFDRIDELDKKWLKEIGEEPSAYLHIAMRG